MKKIIINFISIILILVVTTLEAQSFPKILTPVKKVGQGLKWTGKHIVGGFLRIFFDSKGKPYDINR